MRAFMLTVFSAATLGSAYAAPARPTKPLEKRRPGTIERAFKLGFSRQARLRGEAAALDRRNQSLENELYREAGPDTGKVPLPTARLEEGRQHLAKAAPEVRASAALDASMRGTYLGWSGATKESSTVTYQNYIQALHAMKPYALREANRAKIDALRASAMAKLDENFARSRPAFLARLENEPLETLVPLAHRLIHEIDEQASGRAIRMQQTGEMHVNTSSSSTHVDRGLFRTHHSETSSASSMDSVTNGLVISASHYKVRIANVEAAEQGRLQPNDLDAVQARVFAEKVLTAGDIIRAIKTRNPAAGSAFGQWERESTVEFVTPKHKENVYGNVPEVSHTIQVARAAKDLSHLGGETYMTPAFAAHLGDETKGRNRVSFGGEDVFKD